MKKHQQKKHHWSGLLVLIIAIVVVGITNYAIAQPSFTTDSTFRGEVIKETSQIAANNLLAEGNPFVAGEMLFGSSGLVTTGTPELYGGFTSINISEELRFGDNDPKTGEGYSQWLVVKDCTDATTTLMSFQNKYGENIYIRDMWVDLLGKATSTVRFAVSTTTSAFYARDDFTLLLGDAVGTLMKSMGSLGQDDGLAATGTRVFMGDFKGTNTSVGNHTPILWKPDVYIVAMATTTDVGNWQINNAANTLDCEIYIKLERFD